jgi:hypothetical protein
MPYSLPHDGFVNVAVETYTRRLGLMIRLLLLRRPFPEIFLIIILQFIDAHPVYAKVKPKEKGVVDCGDSAILRS